MAEYKVTPMKDRTVCGWIAVASFIIGLVLCDWVMGGKSARLGFRFIDSVWYHYVYKHLVVGDYALPG